LEKIVILKKSKRDFLFKSDFSLYKEVIQGGDK